MNRLIELRTDKDLYQKDIAKVIKKPRRTYTNYEVGYAEIPITSLIILSKYYNVSIDYILYRTDKRNPYKLAKLSPKNKFNRIKSLRLEIPNMTQEKIIKELSINLSTYKKYEQMTINMNISLLHLLADYYKTSIDYIVGNTDEKKAYPKSNVDWYEK